MKKIRRRKVNDKTNIGLLHMSVDGITGSVASNKYTVARVNQEFGTRSTIGALIVDRSGDGTVTGSSSTDKNQTYSIDGQWGTICDNHWNLAAGKVACKELGKYVYLFSLIMVCRCKRIYGDTFKLDIYFTNYVDCARV